MSNQGWADKKAFVLDKATEDSGRFEIISSLDSPLALPEALGRGLKDAQRICLCSPWVEKPFVHLMKERIRQGASIDFLIKKPDGVDKTFQAIEALETEARVMDWRVDVVCVPASSYLHPKFVVVDDKNVFFGSANATNGGLYNNIEVLVAFHEMSSVADRFIQIFEEIRKQNRNYRWELVRDFHGSSINEALVETARIYLREQPNKEARKDHLNWHLRNHGFHFDMAKNGIDEMVRYGILYSPRIDYVRLIPRYE
jgi:hypothetical protein